MSVIIGHACIDERGKATGGVAGDQTKKEVYTRNWYSKPWHTVFRPKNSEDAEKIAKAMEQACANNNIGYDQWQRISLYKLAEAKKWDISKVTDKCETDCSALVSVCCNAAGIRVSKDMYTGNQKDVLKGTGKFNILTDAKYTKSQDYLIRGDILLGNGHTAIVLSNGAKTKVSTTTTEKTTANSFFPARGYFKEGDVSPNVGKIADFMVKTFPYYTKKEALGNTYGPNLIKAVTEFQSRSNLEPDGCFGPLTLAELKKHGFKA
jgi:hypothetical protein